MMITKYESTENELQKKRNAYSGDYLKFLGLKRLISGKQ